MSCHVRFFVLLRALGSGRWPLVRRPRFVTRRFGSSVVPGHLVFHRQPHTFVLPCPLFMSFVSLATPFPGRMGATKQPAVDLVAKVRVMSPNLVGSQPRSGEEHDWCAGTYSGTTH